MKCPECGNDIVFDNFVGLVRDYEMCFKCSCGVIVNDRGEERTVEYYTMW
ncbi:MAG TPA: hypothetical protein GX707_06410 [Epulopiscium sp.]|nr:hypothetical protein [Candidatus Epulonipiscium sp.]